jgi:HEAT repeats
MPDPVRPGDGTNSNLAPANAAEPRPAQAEFTKTPAQVQAAPNSNFSARGTTGARPSWINSYWPVVVCLTGGLAIILGASYLLARMIQSSAKEISTMAATHAADNSSADRASEPAARTSNSSAQQEAEKLLARVAAGDSAAADQVLAESDDWTGNTQRTPRTDQLITASLNLPDIHIREAALQTQLALDGVPRNEQGLAMMEREMDQSDRRAWALWMLGALGNRGVNPSRTASIIESYLADPDVNVRASAVDALSMVATDESIRVVLDRFREDPSPVVQERAACDMAESGMYSHAQRMVAAASLTGWVDDPRLSAQQHGWAAQTLSDISGQSFGADSAAWKNWYEGAR